MNRALFGGFSPYTTGTVLRMPHAISKKRIGISLDNNLYLNLMPYGELLSVSWFTLNHSWSWIFGPLAVIQLNLGKRKSL